MFLRNSLILGAFVALIGCNSAKSPDDAQTSADVSKATAHDSKNTSETIMDNVEAETETQLSAKTISADELEQFNQAVNTAFVQNFVANQPLAENNYYSNWGRLKQLQFLSVSAQEQDLYWQSPLLANTELAGYMPYLTEYFTQFEQSSYLNITTQNWLALQTDYPFLTSFKNNAVEAITDIELVDFSNDNDAAAQQLASVNSTTLLGFDTWLSTTAITRLYWLNSLKIELDLAALSPQVLSERIFQNSDGNYWKMDSIELSGDLQLYQTDNVKMVNLLPSTTDWQLLVLQAKPTAFASVQDNLLQWLSAFDANNILQATSIELPPYNRKATENPDMYFAITQGLYQDGFGFGDSNRVTGDNLTFVDDYHQQSVVVDKDKLVFDFMFEARLTEIDKAKNTNGGGIITTILNPGFECTDPIVYQPNLTSTLIVLKKADAVVSVTQFDLPEGDKLPVCSANMNSAAYELPTPSVNL
ncbi:hypothetical protein ACMZOO_09005 [Catenovulum sp. SX2]|uniref:hypothetical protein n=1 Tax=Catenovulum sp. SX2 TaxID=3398614 RepID=UPI003F84D8EC